MNKVYQYGMIILCAALSTASNNYAGKHRYHHNEVKSEQGVVEVNSVTHFNDMLKNNEWVVVKFYSPHCIHCKHYRQEFINAATQLPEHKFIAVNVDKHSGLSNKYHVGGLPTTMIMHSGKKVEEFGGNTPSKQVVKNVKRATA